MFVARRLPALRPLNARALATVVEAEPTKTQGRRRRKIPPKRPDISLQNPRQWNRPLKPGVVPAYDLALKYLQKDGETLQSEVQLLREKIAEKEQVYQQKSSTASPEELQELDRDLEKLLQKANIVEVQSEINLPDIRWTVNNAMGVYIHF